MYFAIGYFDFAQQPAGLRLATGRNTLSNRIEFRFVIGLYTVIERSRNGHADSKRLTAFLHDSPQSREMQEVCKIDIPCRIKQA